MNFNVIRKMAKDMDISTYRLNFLLRKRNPWRSTRQHRKPQGLHGKTSDVRWFFMPEMVINPFSRPCIPSDWREWSLNVPVRHWRFYICLSI